MERLLPAPGLLGPVEDQVHPVPADNISMTHGSPRSTEALEFRASAQAPKDWVWRLNNSILH